MKVSDILTPLKDAYHNVSEENVRLTRELVFMRKQLRVYERIGEEILKCKCNLLTRGEINRWFCDMRQLVYDVRDMKKKNK